jgi:hypothetical protein
VLLKQGSVGKPASDLVAPAPAAPAGPKAERPRLVAADTRPAPDFGWAWTVPVESPSLANGRDWRTRNRVAQAHRRAVSRALGRSLRTLAVYADHLHAGGTLRVTLTRLGGRALDRHDNLPAALKYCLDGCCLMIGVDDSDDRLDVRYGQEPGGLHGVRVEFHTVEGGQ